MATPLSTSHIMLGKKLHLTTWWKHQSAWHMVQFLHKNRFCHHSWHLYYHKMLPFKSFDALSWQFQPLGVTTWVDVLLLPSSGYQYAHWGRGNMIGKKWVMTGKGWGWKDVKGEINGGRMERDNHVWVLIDLFWEEHRRQNKHRFIAALCASIDLHWQSN